jgi:hypothetical protein
LRHIAKNALIVGLNKCFVYEGEGDTEVGRILTMWEHQRSPDGNAS